MLQYVEYHIVGLTPTIPHNGQLADPTNIYAAKMKEITKKRSKTPEDYRLLEDLEWEGSLYLSHDHRVVVPGTSLIGALARAGKKSGRGDSDRIRSAVTSPGEWALGYEGPKSLEKLKADPNFRHRVSVVIPSTKSRVMRTRPIFRSWNLTFQLAFRPDILAPKDLDNIVSILGTDVGFSDDYKLMGGRFEVVKRRDVKS